MTELTITGISNNGRSIRTAGTVEEPLFLAKDVVEGVGAVWKAYDSIKHVPKEFRVQSDWTLPNGAIVEAWYFTELGLYFYLNRSDKPAALPWQIKVAETLKAIRQGKVIERKDAELDRLRDENHRLRLHVRIFEEFNDDFVYDFDQASALIRDYRKPPFGPKHLKAWLAKRGILCKSHYKNDKPIQAYIENGWFAARVSEFKRRGKRRYETRYFITNRGLNGIVDLAIRENMLSLPAPKQVCLPGFFTGEPRQIERGEP